MMKTMQRVALVGLLGLGLMQSAWAETASVKRRFTDKELVALARSEGYTISKTEAGAITLKVNGKSIGLLNLDDGDLQMYYSIEKQDNNPTFENINQWNRQYRLSRAYLEPDGSISLESDLLVEGGVSDENVKRFIETFVNTSIPAYNQFLLEKMEENKK